VEELVKVPTNFGDSVSLGSSQQRALATEMAAWVKDSKCYTAVGRRLFTEPGNHGFSLARALSSFDEPDLGLATIATKPHKPVRARRCLTARC
jgi:hypothetical protein